MASEREQPELQPCPFCGGEAWQTYNNVIIKGVSEKCAWVYCKKCSARTGYFRRTANEHYIKASEKAWNRRADDGK